MGITFVYVTHDQEEALTMSDRIGVMNKGRLLQVGSAHAIYEAPGSRFVANFIGESNYLEGTVTELRGTQTIDDLEVPIVEVAVEPDIRLTVFGTPDLSPGTQVTVAFRPEKIVIGDCADPSLTNCATGSVVDVVYMGASTTYTVRLANSATVNIRQQNTQAALTTSYHPGDTVTLNWPVEGSKAFVETGDAATQIEPLDTEEALP